jgi:hypothetical protein
MIQLLTKQKEMILNNLSNKILRIVCGMVNSGKPYF